MTMTLDLPQPLLDHVNKMASEAGISPEAAVVRLLEESREQKTKREAAIAYLEKLITEPSDDEGDPDYDLYKALDANRGEGERKLFPPEKKGITW